MKQSTTRRFGLPLIIAATAFLGFQGSAFAETVIVSEFAPKNTLTPGVWENNDVRAAGTTSIVDLTDLGGNLEFNQPLPVAAALLTTGFDNADKAEVGVYDDYGLAGDIIPTLQLAYDFHKAANPGQNAAAAASIKLTFYNATCVDQASAGDCYGTLVYEPYWQGPNPVQDTWTTASINSSNGLFWWTGGFGVGNGAGGPPLNTLADWLTTFSSDFPGASLILVSVGVGSYGQGQIGYFDNVSISHASGGGFDKVYDFDLPVKEVMPVPVDSAWSLLIMMLLLTLAGFVVIRRQADIS